MITPAQLDILHRDYEFVGFERHFTPDPSIVRFLLLLGNSTWLVAWWWYLQTQDIPAMIFKKRVSA